MLAGVANAGFTLDDALAIHPDGTPVYPERLREALRRGDVPNSWMDDDQLVALAASDDLEAFTDYMQKINYDRIFHEDGSARDIKEWRQAVRDDEFYTNLLLQTYPEFYDAIDKGTDDQVQRILMAQQEASVMQQERLARQRDELLRDEL